MKCKSCKKEMVKSIMFLCENNCVANCTYEGEYELQTHLKNKPLTPCDICRGSVDTFLVYDCAECDITIYSKGKRHRKAKLTKFYFGSGWVLPTFNPEHPINHEKNCPCHYCQEIRWINDGIPRGKYETKFRIKLDYDWKNYNILSYIHRIENSDKIPLSIMKENSW